MRGTTWLCMVAVCLLATGCADSTQPQAPATMSSGGTSATGSTRTPESGGARGRVTNPAGAPVAGASVARKPIDPARSITLQAVTTDADGRYTWSLEPGVWEVEVSAPGYRIETKRVTVTAGRWETADLQLQPA